MKLHIFILSTLTYSLVLCSCDNGKTHQAKIDKIASREKALKQVEAQLELSQSKFISMKKTFEKERLQTLADFKKRKAAIEAEKSSQKTIKPSNNHSRQKLKNYKNSKLHSQKP